MQPNEQIESAQMDMVNENQKLNLRVFFSDPSAVQDFQAYVPELKETLQESPLELTDLKVGAAGGRL